MQGQPRGKGRGGRRGIRPEGSEPPENGLEGIQVRLAAVSRPVDPVPLKAIESLLPPFDGGGRRRFGGVYWVRKPECRSNRQRDSQATVHRALLAMVASS